MDPTMLAPAVISLLLPYAKDGAAKLVEALGGEVGRASAGFAGGIAQRLWRRVKDVFAADDDTSTIEAFEKRPERMQPHVEDLLREKLEADPELARELQAMLDDRGPDGVSVSGMMSAIENVNATYYGKVDARGATITGGNLTGLSVNVERPPSDPEDQRPERR